ncbi:DUF4843 domain-containing protein [uncultured Duncaniella sp.]|uniref:DUF4843 domain-containing protein n=1 Tax=uncultured Duncaniella sp. TaxID=2768039 RepID=UPI0025AA0FC0|nr:DUF4843 domain-containing protein [uncultured Duncaniella sp.]
MKKIIYCLLSMTLLWTSCSEEVIDYYSGQESIYFAQQWGVPHFTHDYLSLGGTLVNCLQPSSKIPFGEMIVNDSILNLTIQTSGACKDYDRPFKIEVVTDSTTAIEGTEFELIDNEAVIPAGEVRTKVKMVFHKTSRMDDENLQVQLRLVPGEHFSLPFDSDGFGNMPKIHSGSPYYTEYGGNFDPAIHNIFVNNFLVKPLNWNDYNMGIWSQEKYRLLLDYTGEMLGWTVADWSSPDMWQSRYNVGLNYLAKYLLEQYKKGPEYWVTDPDGTMMWCRHTLLSGLWSEETRPEHMVQ